MKVRLSLTRTEWAGFAVAVQACLAPLGGDDFATVQRRDVLRGLMVKIGLKVPTLKKKGNRLTLTEGESLVLWGVLQERDLGSPLAMVAGLKVVEEMRRQAWDEVRLERVNQERFGVMNGLNM